MFKRFIAVVACMIMLLTIACKKEKETPFSAVGLWKGNMFAYSCKLLNRPDGTARLYLLMPDYDTSKAQNKYDGVYTASNYAYTAVYFSETDTITFETRTVLPQSISGIANIFSQSSTGLVLSTELYKEQ